MLDVTTPRSPGWWMRQLTLRLQARSRGDGWSRERIRNEHSRPGLDLLWDYYRGESPLPSCASGWHESMRSAVRKTRTNYTRLVVSSVHQRVRPAGWRTGVEPDRDGDDMAREVARVNEFDRVIPDAMEWALVMGDAYLMTSPPEDGGSIPRVTAEDPREMITAHDAATGRTLAALKRYRDEWGSGMVTHLYLPGYVYVARQGRPVGDLVLDEARSGPTAWKTSIPIRRLRNSGGVAEHEPHLDLIDRINETTLDRVAIAKHQAFRQRGLRNLPSHYPDDYPDEELAGREIEYPADAFAADPGSLWRLPDGVEVWESTPIDLGPIRLAIKDDVQLLVALTGTPLHYITPDAASGSAEGASTMRETLIFRALDRRAAFGSALVGMMSDVFAAMGDADRADPSKLETIWGPLELHSLSEKATASSAARNDLPWASRMTDIWGYSPADLARLEQERARDLMFSDASP